MYWYTAMYWYILRHPIMYWCTVGHPISAGISYTIPKFELGLCVPSQGMYWYILAQNSDPRLALKL